MAAEQVGEARVPGEVGATRQCQRRDVAWRNDDEAAEAELGQDRRGRMDLLPDGPVALDGKPRLVCRIEADDVEATPGGALGTFGRMQAIPDRRMRLLQRLEFHGHAAE